MEVKEVGGLASTYDPARELKVPQYDVEIWAWKGKYGGTYVADISNIIVDGLNFVWTLNNTETLDFSIDLVQFEKKCKQMGVTPDQVLKPYVHDIRIRRNGEYILGCQVVETNIDIPNDAPVTIQIRCTGFLNLFKDRYLTIPIWSDKTNIDFSSPYIQPYSIAYSTSAYIAGQLVDLAQEYPAPVGIVKNPNADIDRDGWLAPNGVITADPQWPHSGQSHIRVDRDGEGWLTAATRLYVPKGTTVQVSVWVRGQNYQPVQFVQRNYVNDVPTEQSQGFGYVYAYDTNGSYLGQYNNADSNETYPANGSHPSRTQATTRNVYQRYEFTVTTKWDVTYLLIEQKRTSADALWIDDLYVSYPDEDGCRNFYVQSHYPVSYYSNSRPCLKRNYQMQNVKDAIIELTEIDEDPIEFYFTPTRDFYCGFAYSGSSKTGFVGNDNYDLQICYPGNIESMTISRSASNLYNSILNIGSGIGNERIEAQSEDWSSMATYGCRESIVTSNNASEYSRLLEEADGALAEVKNPTNLPKVVIRDGSVNPGNLKIGDRINIYINNGDGYLDSISGAYRVIEYQVTVDQENMETVSLTVERW